jgi:hypothetical protein
MDQLITWHLKPSLVAATLRCGSGVNSRKGQLLCRNTGGVEEVDLPYIERHPD